MNVLNDFYERQTEEDVSVIDISDSIKESFLKIKKMLIAHPDAGEKVSTLSKREVEAWVAWTWFYQQLVEKGLSANEAINVRTRVMEDQHEYGTYKAMAICLASLSSSEDEYGEV